MKWRPFLPTMLVLAALVACTGPQPTATSVPTAMPAAAPSQQAPSAVPPVPTATAVPTTAPSAGALPLSAAGPHPVGWHNFLFRDAARNNKVVGINLYYPAVAPQAGECGKVIQNAKPDASGAPYPVLLAAGEATRRGELEWPWCRLRGGLHGVGRSPATQRKKGDPELRRSRS